MDSICFRQQINSNKTTEAVEFSPVYEYDVLIYWFLANLTILSYPLSLSVFFFIVSKVT